MPCQREGGVTRAGTERRRQVGRAVRRACPLGRWGADAWAGVPLECGTAGSVGGRWRERVRSGADVLASGARRQREGMRARGRARRGASARGLCGTLGCSGSRSVRHGPERERGRWRRVGLRRASGLQARREREGKLGPRGVCVGFPGQFGLSLAGLGLGFSFFSLLIQTKLKLILFEFKFEFEFKTLALKKKNNAPA